MERPTKEQINELPLFQGMPIENIKVVTSLKESLEALNELKKHLVLGFDTETKPTFKKGEVSNGPHVIQISSIDKSYIFPTKFTSAIKNIDSILNDPTIKKVGFGLSEDKKALYRNYSIKVENSEDLSIRVKRFTGVKQRVGVRAAVAMLLNQRLAKSAQKSNWSAFPLQDYQLKYAANDAYSALRIYMKIEESDQSAAYNKSINYAPMAPDS